MAVDHGDRPQVALLHPLVGIMKRVAQTGRHQFAAADVLELRPHVHHDPRRREAGPLEHELRPLVGRTTAGSDGFWTTRAAQILRVGDRGADGVGIGIAVAEDKQAHAVLRASPGA